MFSDKKSVNISVRAASFFIRECTDKVYKKCVFFSPNGHMRKWKKKCPDTTQVSTRMWANAQRDGRPAE